MSRRHGSVPTPNIVSEPGIPETWSLLDQFKIFLTALLLLICSGPLWGTHEAALDPLFGLVKGHPFLFFAARRLRRQRRVVRDFGVSTRVSDT